MSFSNTERIISCLKKMCKIHEVITCVSVYLTLMKFDVAPCASITRVLCKRNAYATQI